MRSVAITTRSLVAALAAALLASPLVAADSPASDLRAVAVRLPRPTAVDPTPLRDLTSETQEWHQVRGMLSSSDLRKLDAAYVRFTLQSQFLTSPERDPFYDRTRDAVRGGYLKLYREILERQYPLDDLVDEVIAYRQSGGRASSAAEGPSWRLRVSPRLAVGSHGYLGARVSLPATGITRLDRLQLNVRHGVFDREWALGLRYAEGRRFFQLERVAGDDDTGERYTATVVLRF